MHGRDRGWDSAEIDSDVRECGLFEHEGGWGVRGVRPGSTVGTICPDLTSASGLFVLYARESVCESGRRVEGLDLSPLPPPPEHLPLQGRPTEDSVTIDSL